MARTPEINVYYDSRWFQKESPKMQDIYFQHCLRYFIEMYGSGKKACGQDLSEYNKAELEEGLKFMKRKLFSFVRNNMLNIANLERGGRTGLRHMYVVKSQINFGDKSGEGARYFGSISSCIMNIDKEHDDCVIYSIGNTLHMDGIHENGINHFQFYQGTVWFSYQGKWHVVESRNRTDVEPLFTNNDMLRNVQCLVKFKKLFKLNESNTFKWFGNYNIFKFESR